MKKNNNSETKVKRQIKIKKHPFTPSPSLLNALPSPAAETKTLLADMTKAVDAACRPPRAKVPLDPPRNVTDDGCYSRTEGLARRGPL